LGLSEDDTITRITSFGWNFEQDTGFVTPVKISHPEETSSASFDQLMTKLTDFVVFLEN